MDLIARKFWTVEVGDYMPGGWTFVSPPTTLDPY
jgi:hypothetical protein